MTRNCYSVAVVHSVDRKRIEHSFHSVMFAFENVLLLVMVQDYQ